MLNVRSGAGFQFFRLSLSGASGPLRPFAWTHGYQPIHSSRFVLVTFFNTPIAGITPNALFFSVEKIACLGNIVHVARRGADAVNPPECVIDGNVHFHTKVPFMALFDRMHLRVTPTFFVFGR